MSEEELSPELGEWEAQVVRTRSGLHRYEARWAITRWKEGASYITWSAWQKSYMIASTREFDLRSFERVEETAAAAAARQKLLGQKNNPRIVTTSKGKV